MRLEEPRICTAEELIAAELALGHHATLVSEIEALIARHPLRERLWADLMLALYRAGRQGDALAAFQNTRRHAVLSTPVPPLCFVRKNRNMGDAVVRSIDGSRWQDALRAFVFSHLSDRPARILEVGCGKAGELALSLDAAGHEVVTVDPDAPEGAIFRRTVIEHLSEPAPFDVAVASRSLHHIADLDAALDKVVALLSPGGTVLVVEWGWDLVDDETISGPSPECLRWAVSLWDGCRRREPAGRRRAHRNRSSLSSAFSRPLRWTRDSTIPALVRDDAAGAVSDAKAVGIVLTAEDIQRSTAARTRRPVTLNAPAEGVAALQCNRLDALLGARRV